MKTYLFCLSDSGKTLAGSWFEVQSINLISAKMQYSKYLILHKGMSLTDHIQIGHSLDYVEM